MYHCSEIIARKSASLPIIRPAKPGLSLAESVREGHADVRKVLRSHGSILFRGWGILTAEAFSNVVAASGGARMPYEHHSTPRKEIQSLVYTSTEVSKERSIPIHNEMAYSARWPQLLWFGCLSTASLGGATPIAEMANVLRDIPAALEDRVASRKLQYVRTYHDDIGQSWRDAFPGMDRPEVDAYCGREGTAASWLGTDRLRTSRVCDGIREHPHTKTRLWFNQLLVFHASSLPVAIRHALVSLVGADKLPRNVLYGDGEPISDEDVQVVREICDYHTLTFAWHPGDVLVLDNMRWAHGRQPFEGPRRVVVAMTDPVSAAP